MLFAIYKINGEQEISCAIIFKKSYFHYGKQYELRYESR